MLYSIHGHIKYCWTYVICAWMVLWHATVKGQKSSVITRSAQITAHFIILKRKKKYLYIKSLLNSFYVADVFMHVHYQTSTILRFYQLASPMYNYLTVRLLHIVTMTTVWVRPLPLSTSAVISLPKSFVIALICILQLSVLAHSKTNQPLLSDVWIV